jgi:ribonuclease R
MSKKSNKTKKNKNNPIPKIKKWIINLFEENIEESYSVRQINDKLKLKSKQMKKVVPGILQDLEKQGTIKQKKSEVFESNVEKKHITGLVDAVSSRYAYIISTEMDLDVWVAADDLQNAMDGDTVKVVLKSLPKKGRKPEGKVVEIVKRGRDEFVGRLEMSLRYAFVIADYKKMHHDIFVRIDDLKGAKNNDKVIVKIKQYPKKDKNPEGEIIRVLGPAGNNEAEIHSIMAEFNLPFEFPDNVLTQAEKIKSTIDQMEVEKRRDFRETITFTIDPADAKDFDDALSIKKLENGNFEIGVHIADVTHYLKQGSLLDKEGFKRATSVYLVDRTVPMLPERLSNELCSLRPNEEKLTFSAVFEMDREANIIKEWFGKTVIESDRRFTYEEAQERIEKKEGDFSKEIIQLNELALKLKMSRFVRGAINFETTEVKFQLDKNGKPLKVIPRERKDAHKLIEEFMLLANKKVAEYIFNMKTGKNRNTFVYRSHDYPDPDKIKAFSVFAQKFGYTIKIDEQTLATSINKLIDVIEGKPEQNVLQTLAIRAMAKAKYTTKEDGHFGLAFEHYTHFTSPIRRYPDVMVHRLLFHYLNKGKSPDKEEYEEKCLHSSEMEKRAADAERASIKYKQVEFMTKYLMDDFEGVVSGVTEWGVYVEIAETKCEGMVRVSQMLDDYYEYDEQNYRLIGKRNKKIITLGDNVRVRVIATDIDKRTIDLEFVK